VVDVMYTLLIIRKLHNYIIILQKLRNKLS
jgi:hypothetical protein